MPENESGAALSGAVPVLLPAVSAGSPPDSRTGLALKDFKKGPLGHGEDEQSFGLIRREQQIKPRTTLPYARRNEIFERSGGLTEEAPAEKKPG